jgi:hypothetical protein
MAFGNVRYPLLFWVVTIGVGINIFGMALPFIFSPLWTMEHFGLPSGGGSIVWMRQAGLLLLFISLLYLPGGINPELYKANAWFGVITRMTLGLYWLYLVGLENRTSAFLPIGIIDCSYALLNGYVLQRATQVPRWSRVGQLDRG